MFIVSYLHVQAVSTDIGFKFSHSSSLTHTFFPFNHGVLIRQFILVIISFFILISGGAYPHPEVPKSARSKSKPVQQNIWYSPHIEFVVFDVQIDGKAFLDVFEARQLCDTVGLPTIPIAFQGSAEVIELFDIFWFQDIFKRECVHSNCFHHGVFYLEGFAFALLPKFSSVSFAV